MKLIMRSAQRWAPGEKGAGRSLQVDNCYFIIKYISAPGPGQALDAMTCKNGDWVMTIENKPFILKDTAGVTTIDVVCYVFN